MNSQDDIAIVDMDIDVDILASQDTSIVSKSDGM